MVIGRGFGTLIGHMFKVQDYRIVYRFVSTRTGQVGAVGAVGAAYSPQGFVPVTRWLNRQVLWPASKHSTINGFAAVCERCRACW